MQEQTLNDQLCGGHCRCDSYCVLSSFTVFRNCCWGLYRLINVFPHVAMTDWRKLQLKNRSLHFWFAIRIKSHRISCSCSRTGRHKETWSSSDCCALCVFVIALRVRSTLKQHIYRNCNRAVAMLHFWALGTMVPTPDSIVLHCKQFEDFRKMAVIASAF
jgi:hypothetical protein